MPVFKTLTLGAAALSLLCAASATSVLAQDHNDHIIKHDEHRVMGHRTHRVCTTRHHHRVCVTRRW